MRSDNLQIPGVFPLSETSFYDSETGEVILTIDRLTLCFSPEEFAILSKEIEKASITMSKILMIKVHLAKESQEIH